MSSKKGLIILNPVSGRKPNPDLKKILEDSFPQNNGNSVVESESADHIRKLSQQAIQQQFDFVVIAGGDGSVNQVASELAGSGIPLGIIPTGSGNGLARFLKISSDPVGAINIILSGKRQPVDMLEINNYRCVSIAGCGFDAWVAKKFSQKKKRGFQAYAASVISGYFKYKSDEYVILSPAQQTEKAFILSFANTNQYGYNFTIAPEAVIDDGLLDICLVKKVPLYAVPFFLHRMFYGKLKNSRYLKSIQTSSAIIRRKHGTLIHIDGDPLELSGELNISVIKHAIQVFCP
ncbi:MAG: diacylglycerol kinase family lipid kinase [Bacteroidetes bacterium]|nr:diacylglycerol kinase family lipid kinase [Bacteroidota bacterium]MBU1717449.1 diacylglycerol kinase family lipid kinase [Bacteroidota bacterium]